MQRRGMVIGTTEEEGFTRVEANVPLAEMFGYASDLRSATQGKSEFTLEFERGFQLFRVTVNLAVQPDDNMNVNLDGDSDQIIRLISTAMPRNAAFE